ncbi:MAG TPA: MFS transporter [Candidatus Wallbacteria bacterium]|nr:MFS transporter [Candidatus Wallbacteria bacterium]
MSRARILIIVLATGLTSFLSSFLSSSVNLALKSIAAEYAVNPADLSLVTSVFLLFSSLFIVPFGNLSDAYGPKRTLVFGCAFFTASNFLVPLVVNSFSSLVAMRGLQGIGSAFLVVSNIPIITNVIEKKYRSVSLGFLSSLIYLGFATGNFIGGYLTQSFGWKSIFIVSGAGCALAMAIIQAFVPGERTAIKEKTDKKIDYKGIFYYALTLICLQSGANQINNVWGAALLAASASSFVFFIRRQFDAPRPIYDMRLFTGNKVFAMAVLSVFLNFISTYGSQYLISLYLQCNRGLTPLQAGKITLITPLVQIIFAPMAGAFCSRFHPAFIASSGMAITSISLAAFVFLSESTSYALIYASLALAGVGVSFFSTPNTSIIMESVPADRRGMASASNSIMRNLGMQCSIIICGAAFLMVFGETKGIPPEKYPQMLSVIRACYMIFTAAALTGTVISLKRSARL